MKKLIVVAVLLVSVSVSAQTNSLNIKVLDFGSEQRAKIIELEEAKQRIQDTISVYKKGMSKEQKDKLTKDLKALRKCKFQVPCRDEAGVSVSK
jgi:hypothetical protein